MSEEPATSDPSAQREEPASNPSAQREEPATSDASTQRDKPASLLGIRSRFSLERWEALTTWPLAAAALIFLVSYSWAVIADVHGPLRHLANIINWVVWGVFVVDYAVSLLLAPRRVHWFFRHLFSLAIVALPALRPLQLLRVLSFARIFQTRAGAAFRGRVSLYVACTAVLLLFIGSVAELQAERGAKGANIEDFGDALWWGISTITTVGYGDVYPVTFLGRTVAAGMMIAGVALIGSVTATLASWIVTEATSHAGAPRASRIHRHGRDHHHGGVTAGVGTSSSTEPESRPDAASASAGRE